MYTFGLTIVLLYMILLYWWIKKMQNTLYLTRLGLTLIPSDALNE